MSEYGIELGVALYGEEALGARRLWSLVKGLPPGSALHRALDPEGWMWTQTDELLAGVIEFIDLGNRMYLKANSSGGKDPDPVVIPRPGRKEPEPKKPNTNLHSFFAPETVRYTP